MTTDRTAHLATTAEPSIALMLQTMVERGITGESVAAFAQLCSLKERMDDRDAEKQFNAAFSKLQSELPTIVASSIIPNRGKYERFEDVMRQIQPALSANGFSVSFSQSFAEGRIIETCKLKHSAGHSESNSFGVRLGGKADSETQADCKASTTAKRNALLNALNIVIRQDIMQNEDDDASLVGEPITEKEAVTLAEWVEAVGADKAAFLRFAGAPDFYNIAASRLAELHKLLKAKEARK